MLNVLDIHSIFLNYFSIFKVKLADGATLIVKISDSRKCDELKEPFPVNTLYLPIKTKTKHKGVAKPLSELLPTSVDSKKFKDDLLNSFKEVAMHIHYTLTISLVSEPAVYVAMCA